MRTVILSIAVLLGSASASYRKDVSLLVALLPKKNWLCISHSRVESTTTSTPELHEQFLAITDPDSTEYGRHLTQESLGKLCLEAK